MTHQLSHYISLSLVLSCFVAIFTVQACLYLLKPIAIHVGLVDMPGGRKKHENAVPFIGSDIADAIWAFDDKPTGQFIFLWRH